jgi:hypothetical protein
MDPWGGGGRGEVRELTIEPGRWVAKYNRDEWLRSHRVQEVPQQQSVSGFEIHTILNNLESRST